MKYEIGYPKVTDVDLCFSLSTIHMKKYKLFHKNFLIEFDQLTVDKSQHRGKMYSSAVSYIYCSQYVCGYLYENQKELTISGKVKTRTFRHIIHEERLYILQSLIKELNGQPLLVLYHNKADLDLFRLLKLKNYAEIYGGMKPEVIQNILNRWNTGEFSVLASQISMTSLGLNLQFGGWNLCFFNVPDRYDDYYQSIHRLVRPGQKHYVTVYRIICRGTVDEINRLQILNKKIFTAKEFHKKLETLS